VRSQSGNQKKVAQELEAREAEGDKGEEGDSAALGYIASGQRLMIQSFLDESYLQIPEEEPDKKEGEGEPEEVSTRRTVVGEAYQKKARNKMIFVLEEVPAADSVYSYQGSAVFDELLEYYAFLNVWAVSPVGQDTDKAEAWYYKHDAAAELEEPLRTRSAKITFILHNLAQLLKKVESQAAALSECRSQLQEQGILDISFRCLEIMYYKMTPPPMFAKPFRSVAAVQKLEQLRANKKEAHGLFDRKTVATLRVDEYMA
jgi:hypothetical protein